MNAPVLFIGGMDSSAGAGLLRDCATAEALGLSHRVAVTAVTAQSDLQMGAIHPVPPGVVAAQVALAGRPGAIKIGMLASAATIRTLAMMLPPAPVVLDPVLMSSSGGALLAPAGLEALIGWLLPRTTLLTPNLPELCRLAGALGLPEDAPEAVQVRALLDRGAEAVLVKGGHAEDLAQSVDRLYRDGSAPQSFAAPRLPGQLRGTGCQLASAIACHLARGTDLAEAVIRAKAMLSARFAEAACEAPFR